MPDNWLRTFICLLEWFGKNKTLDGCSLISKGLEPAGWRLTLIATDDSTIIVEKSFRWLYRHVHLLLHSSSDFSFSFLPTSLVSSYRFLIYSYTKFFVTDLKSFRYGKQWQNICIRAGKVQRILFRNTTVKCLELDLWIWLFLRLQFLGWNIPQTLVLHRVTLLIIVWIVSSVFYIYEFYAEWFCESLLATFYFF